MNEERGMAVRATEYTDKPKGINYFIGIGINTYQHFTPLFNARKDVEDVCALLCESFHFDKKHVTLLLDEDATRSKIL